MNLSQEVSSMETELVSLRTENDLLKKQAAVVEWENEQLKRLLTRSNVERDTYLRRSEAIKTLLDQCGASLVNGIQKFHATERELQEQQLGVGEDKPQFLTAPSKDDRLPSNSLVN